MKTRTAILIAVLSGFASVGFSEEHAHHRTNQNMEIQLDHGKKWATDKPLRQAMEKIRALAKESQSAIYDDKQTGADYLKLGQAIKEQTDGIFKNCKLPPAADKELHKILIPILSSTETFTGNAPNKDKREAFSVLLRSLDQYDSHFEQSPQK